MHLLTACRISHRTDSGGWRNTFITATWQALARRCLLWHSDSLAGFKGAHLDIGSASPASGSGRLADSSVVVQPGLLPLALSRLGTSPARPSAFTSSAVRLEARKTWVALQLIPLNWSFDVITSLYTASALPLWSKLGYKADTSNDPTVTSVRPSSCILVSTSCSWLRTSPVLLSSNLGETEFTYRLKEVCKDIPGP